MNVVREIQKINERELKEGLTGSASWHHKYRCHSCRAHSDIRASAASNSATKPQVHICAPHFCNIYMHRESAWVFIGGMTYDLTEGDVLCVMSQWGEVEDINLVRDQDSVKSKGFAFLKYEVSVCEHTPTEYLQWSVLILCLS